MNTSTEIKSIAMAMIKVQKEIKGMTPDAKNPFFKSSYITLDGILEYVRPILTNNEIWLVQEAKGLDLNISVKTSLIHSSGEFFETESLEMQPAKNDPQAVGSLITYLKRYQLASLLGISSEVDDDGNKATHGDKKPAEKQEIEFISEPQQKRLFNLGKGNTQLVKEVLMAHGFTKSSEIPKGKAYEEICKEIQGKVV